MSQTSGSAEESFASDIASTDGAMPTGTSLGASFTPTEVVRPSKLTSLSNAHSAVLVSHIEEKKIELAASCVLREEISSVDVGGQPGQS